MAMNTRTGLGKYSHLTLIAASVILAVGCTGQGTSGQAGSGYRAKVSAHAQQALDALPGVNTVATGNIGEVIAVTGTLGRDIERAAQVFNVTADNTEATDGGTPPVDDYESLGPCGSIAQTRNGLALEGAEVKWCRDTAGELRAMFGIEVPDDAVPPPTASISADQAIKTARTARPLQDVTSGDAELVYVIANDRNNEPPGPLIHLAWKVEVQGTDPDDGTPVDTLVYVDGSDGSVIEDHSQVNSILQRYVYTGLDRGFIPGFLVRREGQPPVNDPPFQTVNAAYDHTGFTWLFYRNVFGRDSVNGFGYPLISTIHFAFPYNNAFWNGSQMVFGDGDNGATFFPLALALDITAHELTHGVTQFSSRLAYFGESGALNEGMSDVFGASTNAYIRGFSPNIWKLGLGVFRPGTGQGLRYMDNPTLDGVSRDLYPLRYLGPADNGGVHWNNGISNLAFKLLVTGGRHPRGFNPAIVVPALGIEASRAIYYVANTRYLGPASNFRTARYATAQAAWDIYRNIGVVNAVHASWDAVSVPR